MIKELKFRKIIETIIGEINEAKRKSETIYDTGDINACGAEVENLIREKISLFLPERYLVKQGHIVNSDGKVSNQLDIIIFDRLNTPKFFKSQNDTVYYPIESVLAVGEIKKTLRKNDLLEFGKKIKYLKVDMQRKLIKNTIYGGKLKNATFADIINMKKDRKNKNSLFSFLIAIDEEDINKLLIADDNKFMPNDVYVLNHGYLIYGDLENQKINPKIEDEFPIMDTWLEIKKPGVDCLAMMFNQLINHLNGCHIEPFSISNYMSSTDFDIFGSDVSMYGKRSDKSE